MRKILLALIITGSSLSLKAQTGIAPSSLKKDWSSLLLTEEIKIDIRKESCKIEHVSKPFDYAFLRVENSGQSELVVSFQLAVKYSDGTCAGCDTSVETVRTIIIPANSTLESDCSFKNGQLSYLLKSPFINASGVGIESLEITNLQITK